MSFLIGFLQTAVLKCSAVQLQRLQRVLDIEGLFCFTSNNNVGLHLTEALISHSSLGNVSRHGALSQFVK